MSSQSLFELEEIFQIKIDDEYKTLLRDCYKTLIIYSIIYTLSSFIKPPGTDALKVFLTELFLFIVIGLSAYHLVLKKIIEF
jgi:hypothetical protein